MPKKNWRIPLIIILSVLTIGANFFVGLYASSRLSLFLELSVIIFPIILLSIHASALMPFGRYLFFVATASFVGFLSEFIGMKYGVIFGGSYVYDDRFLAVFKIPWFVMAYWAFFIYSGYSFTNSFLFWAGKQLPVKINNDLRRLPALVFADAYLVTIIDLFMDPLQVKLGLWRWSGNGLYFGIPLGNFFGWFMIAAIVSAIVRLSVYFLPFESNKYAYNIHLVPVFGYLALFASCLFYAIKLDMIYLAWIGCLLGFPIVILNIKLYLNWRKRHSGLALPEEIC